MILIAGLGNPGPGFHRTRHNVGFRVLDRLAERFGVAWRKARRGSLELAEATRGRKAVLLVKPQTFMNRSGQPLATLLRNHRLPLTKLWVVVDDLDLPVGQLRLRLKGSSGGHHGLDSLIAHVGSADFPRLRIGIGRTQKPPHFDAARYVLARLSTFEDRRLSVTIDQAADALTHAIDFGFPSAMNRWNQKREA